ncbi:MAG: hypothetical protein ACR2KE_05125 [Candidatus Nanopelagicales bacterium]
MSTTILISAMFSWKDGADSASVGAAHWALADFTRHVPGVRVCRYGLNSDHRTSVVYAIYDSPEVLQTVFDALATRGGDIMTAELEVTELIPGQSLIQGSTQSLDAVSGVIARWGLTRFDTDSQGTTHVAL